MDASTVTEGKEIEQGSEYVYLCHLMNRSCSSQGEISRRKCAGWITISRIKATLLNGALNMKVKRDLLNSTAIPAVTYTAECWSTTKADKDRFRLEKEQRNACFAKSHREIIYRIKNFEIELKSKT